MIYYCFLNMSNTKDDISGAGTDHSVKALVQYSTDSLSTMPSQSVTSTNSTANMVSAYDVTCLRQYIHEFILQCTICVGLKPDKRKTNVTNKCILNNLTVIQLIFNTGRSGTESTVIYMVTYLTRSYVHI
jgi:hypothetical protein